MPSPTASVIVGTYNCAAFLPGLWACLDAQTFRDFEIVVVDDASTDGETIRALEAMGDRIRLIRRERNSATCELPRYQGVKAARTDLCAFLDADDRWDPAFLETTVSYMQAHPEVALVHTYARVIDGQDRVQRIRHEGNVPVGDRVARQLLEHCFITISAVVARRTSWLEALAESEITDFGMDQDFFLAIATRRPIGFIPEALASYRRSEASVSVKKWKRAPRNVNTLERILRKGMYAGLATDAEMKAILRGAYRENAEFWRNAVEPRRALWFCAQGLRRFPIDAPLWISTLKSLIRLPTDHRAPVIGH
ncbi:MAG TPA: glycosyltransferase family 2 protein [Kiritimatiellia bacterium]|nr:glycosyltransferase family 2 protein [Kiritimatiellia bacterium]